MSTISLTGINIKNYKAFKEVYIPFKPITILLGANSIGKSSIIQLLLLLKQTAKEDNRSYKSVLRLYGDYVNIGEPINLFHKLKTDLPIELKLHAKSIDLQKYFIRLNDRFKAELEDVLWYFPIQNEEYKELRDRRLIGKLDLMDYFKRFKEVYNDDKLNEALIDKYSLYRDESNIINVAEILKESNNEKTCRIIEFLSSLSKNIITDSFEFTFKIQYISNKLYVSEVSISSNEKYILSLFHYNSKVYIRSDFMEINSTEMDEITSFFFRSDPIFTCIHIGEQGFKGLSTLSRHVLSIFEYALSELKSSFNTNRINYVSPLRAHPKRYYMLDKANVNDTLDTYDGDAIAEVLRDKPTIKTRVNHWLKNFGFSVDVEEFKEVIHHLKVNQNNLNLNIKDVGFGISQVLPVIIQGFLSSNNSLTMVEQPEIHLHPKMQADLSDLFIEIVKGKKFKKLVIETHSEYLLRRLRRRIAENKDITFEDVAICVFYMEKEAQISQVKILDIKDKGYFEWPKEFYGGELYNDTIQFLRLQG